MSDAALRNPPRSSPQISAGSLSAARSSKRTLVVGALALLLAAAGVVYIAVPKGSTSTDDAYLHADSTMVAAKVRGLIAKIPVHDNQVVSRGDPLIQIDAEKFDARVASAEADVASAKASIQSAAAALEALEAE